MVTAFTLPPKGDVVDYLDAGHSRDDLLDLVKRTPLWEPHAARTGPTDGQHDEPHAADAEKVSPRPVVRSMADVEARLVTHLWRGYLVKHKFNLIAGYGGVGKGQLMAHLIARLSRGQTMPYEVVPSQTRPLRILILAAEDDAHEDIRPRLDANGADMDNVFILDGIDNGDGDVRWVDIQKHIVFVEQAIIDHTIDIVYIDPLASYLPGVRRQNGGEVREALGHIQRLINKTGVTVIGALHLGKEALNRRGAMKVLDSVEFTNLARNVIGVNDLPDEHQPEDVRDEADLGRRKILAVLKSNSMIPGPPLVWSRPLDEAVQWHGVAAIGFDETFRPQEREGQRGEAKAWLADLLRGGMQPQSDVERMAKIEGFSVATLRRAKRDLGVKSHKNGLSGPWFWMLPTTPPPEDAQHLHTSNVSTFEVAEDAHETVLNGLITFDPTDGDYVEVI